MNTDCLQFRWINASCYEFKLLDGRIITIDPFLDRSDKSFTVEDLSTPDYVLITHTHFDHIMELGALMERNDSARVFVSEITATELADYFQIRFGQVYGVENNLRLDVDGISILPSHGKHSRFKVRSRESLKWLANAAEKECGAKGQEQLMLLGSTVYTDYTVTLPYNLKIFITGGDKTLSVPYDTAREQAPFIVVRQVSNLDSPEQYAEIVARLGGKIVLPHHQEHPERRLGMPMAEFVERVNAHLNKIAPGMVMLHPQQYKWYELGISVKEV